MNLQKFILEKQNQQIINEFNKLTVDDHAIEVYKKCVKGKANKSDTYVKDKLKRNYLCAKFLYVNNQNMEVREYGSLLIKSKNNIIVTVYNQQDKHGIPLNINENIKNVLDEYIELLNRKVTLVVGASGTGKDYAVDYLCKEYGYDKVISRTTRKPRYNGENTHLFVSEEQADEEFNREDVIAKTNYNGCRYYTLPKDLKGKDFYIIDVQGVRSMDRYKYDKVVFIKAPIWTRFKQMRKRGDSIKSIIKRLITDSKEFRGFKGDVEFKSSQEFIKYYEGLSNV